MLKWLAACSLFDHYSKCHTSTTLSVVAIAFDNIMAVLVFFCFDLLWGEGVREGEKGASESG